MLTEEDVPVMAIPPPETWAVLPSRMLYLTVTPELLSISIPPPKSQHFVPGGRAPHGEAGGVMTATTPGRRASTGGPWL